MKARRSGFQLVADFPGANFYIQSAFLDVVFADVVTFHFWEEPTKTTIIGSYMLLSRVKFTEKLKLDSWRF